MLILMLLIGREMFVVRDGAGADGCVPFSTTRLLSHRRRRARAGAITAFIIFKRDSLFVKDALRPFILKTERDFVDSNK